jgi:delta 1-pyrroline-5-carboxylate dehydrogenase
LKKYPKRKRRAYHISDYVYPQLSPKKKKIDYIEVSSDEETKNCESDKQMPEKCVRSKTCQNRTKNTRKTDIYKDTGIKKLKSVKHTKHLNKQQGVKTMQSVIPTTHSYIKKTNHSDVGRVLHDDVFKDLSIVLTDKLKQEEADRQLALKLEKIFQYEKTGNFSAIRMKGSDNEYNFRRKSNFSSK